MTPRAQERSAFFTHQGLYHFKRMSFGLSNETATFCRLVHRVLPDHLWRICLYYLDDVIVYAKSKQELLVRLHTILSCFGSVGLKVNPSKCTLFKECISYFGHVVPSDGIDPQSEKIQAIQDWPVQMCLRDVRVLYGLASYYVKFVKVFAAIEEPLSALTKKGIRFQWTKEAHNADRHTSGVDYKAEHRPGRLHSNADGLSRPFCKKCYDRPRHITWVDKMERTNDVVGPWSVHITAVSSELHDVQMKRKQNDDAVFGPIKLML